MNRIFPEGRSRWLIASGKNVASKLDLLLITLPVQNENFFLTAVKHENKNFKHEI